MEASRTHARLVPALIVALAVVVGAAIAVVLLRSSAFSDLDVYRWTAAEVFEPFQLYDERDPLQGMQFLYPPFAALLTVALEAIGLLGNATFSLLTLLALGRSAWLVAVSAPRVMASQPRWVLAVLLATLAAATEPTIETLRLGQVGILLMWLVLEDLLPPRRRLRGVLVGLAIGIKLTPVIFTTLLAVTGRWRAAVVSVATFAATVAIGWIALPSESRRFFVEGAGLDSKRTDGLEFVGNQSLNGVLLRTVDRDLPTLAWLAVAAATGLLCLWLARAWWREGSGEARLVAVGLMGLASVLASPISWTHHWVIVLPLLVGLWGARPSRVVYAAVVVAWLVLCSRIVWRVPHSNEVEFTHSPAQALVASSYVLLGALLLMLAWAVRPRRQPSS